MSAAAEVAPSQPTAGAVPTTPSSVASSISTPRSQPQLPGLTRSPLPSPYQPPVQSTTRSESPHLQHQRRSSAQHPSSLPPPLPPTSLNLPTQPPRYQSSSSPSTPGEHNRPPSFFSLSHTPRTVPGMLLPGERGRSGIRELPPMSSVLPSVSSQSVAMALSESQAALDALSADQTAPRKRSKVSRACDECRRKKIRCDATSESGMEQCSSCRRVGTKCSFSRVPMKRGPSKGYIKELAERLNTLENSISTGDIIHHQYGAEGEVSPGPSDSTSPPPGGPVPQRKRTLSTSSDYHSGFHLQPLSHVGASGRSPENRLPPIDSFNTAQRSQPLQHESQSRLPRLGKQSPPSVLDSNSSNYRYTPISPGGREQPWKSYADQEPRRRASIGSFVHPPETSSLVDKTSSFNWDEQYIDQYYTLVHPTFPLLPHSKARLRQRLSSAPTVLRDALLEALYAVVRSSPVSSPRLNLPSSNPRQATELFLIAQFDVNISSASDNLLIVQILILLALEADNHGPTPAGPGRATLVGAAVGKSHSMKLHYSGSGGERVAVGDPDSEENLRRRAWLVLVVLDRWQAIATNSPLLVPDSNVVLLPEDQQLLGVAPFHLVRLSCILGHVSEAFTSTDPALSAACTTPFISRLLRGELERFRESAEVVWGSLSLLHVAYYHVKLLALRYNPTSEPRHLLEPALRVVTLLDHSSMPITPLNHHFAALAVETLVALTEEDEKDVSEEAWRGLETIEEAMRKKRGIVAREGSDGWEGRVAELVKRRLEARARGRGLERLVEAAMGGTGKEKGIEGSALRQVGYLGCIR